jgi:hypothetical protein
MMVRTVFAIASAERVIGLLCIMNLKEVDQMRVWYVISGEQMDTDFD